MSTPFDRWTFDRWIVQAKLSLAQPEPVRTRFLACDAIYALARVAGLDQAYLLALAQSTLGSARDSDAWSLAAAIEERVAAFLRHRGLRIFVEEKRGKRARGARSKAPADEAQTVVSSTEIGHDWQAVVLQQSGEPALVERAGLDDERKAELGQMLAINALLADLLDELGDYESATTIRTRPLGDDAPAIWRHWIPLAVRPQATDEERSSARAALPQAVSLIADAVRQSLAELGSRSKKIPVPTLPGWVVSGAMHKLQTQDGAGKALGARKKEGSKLWEPLQLQAVRAAPVASILELDEQAGQLDDETVIILGYLATRVHEQWVRGVHEHSIVEVVASQDAMAKIGLPDRFTVDDFAKRLDVLKAWKAGGGALVTAYTLGVESRAMGRPSTCFIVQAGWPITPMRATALMEKRGLIAHVPMADRWYSFVLDPTSAPKIGNVRTFVRRRAVYTIGPGQWLMHNRDEYAEKGGVDIRTFGDYLEGNEIYHRSHSSLRDNFIDALTRPPAQYELGMPHGPLLVPIESGSSLYKLGPEYAKHEQLILAASQVPDEKRKAAAKRIALEHKRRRRGE